MISLKEQAEKYLRKNNLKRFDIKAILFDMDGVLYDSMPAHATSWEKTVSELGIPCKKEEFYLVEGQTGRQTISQLFQRHFGRPSTDEENKSIYARKTKYFTQLGPAPVMAGAPEVLKQTQLAHLTPILVTGSGQASLLDKLSHHFPNTFTRDKMITAHDVQHGKPNPEPYLRALEIFKGNPSQALVIENAPLGVRAAVAAGIFTIAVNTGPISAQLLYDEGANIVLESMSDLATHFMEILEILQKAHS